MKIPEVSYATPALRYDREARTVVFERRDPATGEVAFQIPSQRALEASRSKATSPTREAEPAPSDAAPSDVSPADGEAETASPAPGGSHHVSVFA